MDGVERKVVTDEEKVVVDEGREKRGREITVKSGKWKKPGIHGKNRETRQASDDS